MEEDDEGVLEEMPLKIIIPTSKLFLYKVLLKKVIISQSPVVCNVVCIYLGYLFFKYYKLYSTIVCIYLL